MYQGWLKATRRFFILEIQQLLDILVERYTVLCIANYMITNTLSDKK